jgi:hypothetical protein
MKVLYEVNIVRSMYMLLMCILLNMLEQIISSVTY